jgi:hypothetical protein
MIMLRVDTGRSRGQQHPLRKTVALQPRSEARGVRELLRGPMCVKRIPATIADVPFTITERWRFLADNR